MPRTSFGLTASSATATLMNMPKSRCGRVPLHYTPTRRTQPSLSRTDRIRREIPITEVKNIEIGDANAFIGYVC